MAKATSRSWIAGVAAGALVVALALAAAVLVLEGRRDRAAAAAAASFDPAAFVEAARGAGAVLAHVACLRRPGDDAAACYLDALDRAAASVEAAAGEDAGELPAVAAHALAAGAVAPTCRFIGPVLPVPEDPYDLPAPAVAAARPLAGALLRLAADMEAGGQPEQAQAWAVAVLSFGEHLGQSVVLAVHVAGLDVQEEAALELAELYRARGCADEAASVAAAASAVAELRRREAELWEVLSDLPRSERGREVVRRLYADPATPDALRLELVLAAAAAHLGSPVGRLRGPSTEQRELVAELVGTGTGDPLLDRLATAAARRLDLPLSARLGGVQHAAALPRM